jgi:hypothetical protein
MRNGLGVPAGGGSVARRYPAPWQSARVDERTADPSPRSFRRTRAHRARGRRSKLPRKASCNSGSEGGLAPPSRTGMTFVVLFAPCSRRASLTSTRAKSTAERVACSDEASSDRQTRSASGGMEAAQRAANTFPDGHLPDHPSLVGYIVGELSPHQAAELFALLKGRGRRQLSWPAKIIGGEQRR